MTFENMADIQFTSIAWQQTNGFVMVEKIVTLANTELMKAGKNVIERLF